MGTIDNPHPGRTLQQWLEWQQSLHSQEIDLGLERVRQVWHNLTKSQDITHFPPVITVAGTNGKGSTVRFLENIYRQALFNSRQFNG